MHRINVLAFGSENFNTSLDELKDYLKFKLTCTTINEEEEIRDNYDVLLIHENFLKKTSSKNFLLEKSNQIKILATNESKKKGNLFNATISLPTNIKILNEIIKNSIIKKHFVQNSKIPIKGYILDKNEKKITKDLNFVSLTEKEIQLLELFLKSDKSINKNKILNEVWKYASDADTHTVETHIYRLRKKIKNKFDDDDFILNDKEGYSL